MDINEEMTGLCEVEFSNGDVKKLKVKRHILNPQAFPIYLETTIGTLYNWQNIISIRLSEF